MIRRAWLVFAFFVLAEAALGAGAPPTSVFLLRVKRQSSGDDAGTAFATTYRGKVGVMTAYHVTDVPAEPYVVTGAGQSLTLVFVRLGTSDVAFSETPVPAEWTVLTLGKPPLPGEEATAWGLPEFGGKVSSSGPVRGTYSNVEHVLSSRGEFVRIRTPSMPGMSGGPVIGPDRSVFGVVGMVRKIQTVTGDEFAETVASTIP